MICAILRRERSSRRSPIGPCAKDRHAASDAREWATSLVHRSRTSPSFSTHGSELRARNRFPELLETLFAATNGWSRVSCLANRRSRGRSRLRLPCLSRRSARHQFVTKTSRLRALWQPVRTGKARQAKGFSFLTTELTRWRSAVRARPGLPSIPLVLLNSGRNSLRNLAKLVTICHPLRKVFDCFPQVRGNRHRVEL